MERSQRKAHLLVQQNHKSDGGCKLRYVVFDIVMWKGEDISQWPCKRRFKLLEDKFEQKLRTNTNHVRVIENTQYIKTAHELVELLREATKLKLEGYVLKDPTAPYYFQKTRSVQKVKLTGPEINVGVVGVGFSLSINPRRWGLLTAVKVRSGSISDDTANFDDDDGDGFSVDQGDYQEEEEGGGVSTKTKQNQHQFLITYCRTEVLEGDNLNCAFEQVFLCNSKVNVKDIIGGVHNRPQKRKRNDNTIIATALTHKKVIELDQYSVFVDYYVPGTKKWLRVRWKARENSEENQDCVLLIQEDALNDIQWICNPLECAFSLSLRGDLRPVVRTLQYGIGDASSEVPSTETHTKKKRTDIAATSTAEREEMWLPRNPVGRVELVLHHQSSQQWDSLASIRAKFNEAQQIATCVENHTLRRIARLRSLPPKRENLEEIGRTVIAWLSSCIVSDGGGQSGEAIKEAEEELDELAARTKKKGALKKQKSSGQNKNDEGEEWPQIPPGSFITIDGLSDTLEGAKAKLLKLVPSLSTHEDSKQLLGIALKKLTTEERKAMAFLKAPSMWLPLQEAQRQKSIKKKDQSFFPPSADEAYKTAFMEGNMEKYIKRLKELQQQSTSGTKLQALVLPCTNTSASASYLVDTAATTIIKKKDNTEKKNNNNNTLLQPSSSLQQIKEEKEKTPSQVKKTQTKKSNKQGQKTKQKTPEKKFQDEKKAATVGTTGDKYNNNSGSLKVMMEIMIPASSYTQVTCNIPLFPASPPFQTTSPTQFTLFSNSSSSSDDDDDDGATSSSMSSHSTASSSCLSSLLAN